MKDRTAKLKMLQARMAGIGAELDGDWAATLRSQLHLDRDTPECAYWHAGYYQALEDVLSALSKPRSISDISDRSSPIHVAG